MLKVHPEPVRTGAVVEIPAGRGLGTLLAGPAPSNFPTGTVRVVAPPGIMLRTESGNAKPFSTHGWRFGTWLPISGQDSSYIDTRRPDSHTEVTFQMARTWLASLPGAPVLDGWMQAAMETALSTWVRIILLPSNADERLRRDAVMQFEESLLDCTRAWGEDWYRLRASPETQSSLAEAMRDLHQVAEETKKSTRDQIEASELDASLSFCDCC